MEEWFKFGWRENDCIFSSKRINFNDTFEDYKTILELTLKVPVSYDEMTVGHKNLRKEVMNFIKKDKKLIKEIKTLEQMTKTC